MILKDATPYNVQSGARPVFVDVGSFERLREGEPWVGYRQFCMLYLFPLLLQAEKDVPVPAAAARLPRRHHAAADARPAVVPRPLPQGLLINVVLHASSRPSTADRGEEVKRRVKRPASRRS